MYVPDALDMAYRNQRIRLHLAVDRAAETLWGSASMQNQEPLVRRAGQLALAAQAQTVRLTAAYMSAKTRRATGRARTLGLDVAEYTVDKIRGVPVEEVYARPFGVVGHALEQGVDFALARQRGRSSLLKALSTDIQLAQVRSARDWMGEEAEITAVFRLVAGTCDFCKSAAADLGSAGAQMPIHEHCRCTAVPMFGEEPTAQPKVLEDDEIGVRLPTDLADFEGQSGRMAQAELDRLEIFHTSSGNLAKVAEEGFKVEPSGTQVWGRGVYGSLDLESAAQYKLPGYKTVQLELRGLDAHDVFVWDVRGTAAEGVTQEALLRAVGADAATFTKTWRASWREQKKRLKAYLDGEIAEAPRILPVEIHKSEALTEMLRARGIKAVVIRDTSPPRIGVGGSQIVVFDAEKIRVKRRR